MFEISYPDISHKALPRGNVGITILRVWKTVTVGISGGMNLRNGADASGRKLSPIYDTRDWSPSGDVYVGGTTGLAIWAVTLAGLLAGGALLVYNTSALVQ
ncbi:hypothetical protein GH714_011723 [Hevea brasiliensis]|uniref:Photosystem II 10 kDa polypeptide, chloroplastic n=1 Tax=Hevea brasiliensis TaxID=3981 RepID=A0A6A6KCY5_HEVBR|nr:hypothetical protein GH714_011723 [Hevea brasiliensis]